MLIKLIPLNGSTSAQNNSVHFVQWPLFGATLKGTNMEENAISQSGGRPGDTWEVR